MIRRMLVLALLVLSAPASTQTAPVGRERREAVGSFERVRVDGPLDVTFTPGSPGARVLGDAWAVEAVQLSVDGSTLRLRAGVVDREKRGRDASTGPVRVILSSPALAGAVVSAGGRLRATRFRGTRVDLSVNGAGEIEAGDVQGDQVQAMLIGPGSMTLSGKARTARLTANGPGRIDASALQADEATVLLDGQGEIKAAARYTARVTNVGLGAVSVAGRPKCTVTARAGGAVACGR